MKIISDLSGETLDGVNHYLRLEEFSESSSSEVLMYGYSCTSNRVLQRAYENFERKVLLDLWSPCAMFNRNKYDEDHFQQLEWFDEVYSICPFTVDWTNEQLGYDLMKCIWYPIGKHVESPKQDKIYDVIFFGGVSSPEHQRAVEIISKFNYCFTSLEQHPLATHLFLSNMEKMNKVAQSKIGVCFNLLYPKRDLHLPFIKEYQNWQENKAFSRIEEEICPQFKSRVHECALSKTLILCKRDDWNLIEDFYAPNEFVYFDSLDELGDKIKEILENWDAYQAIINKAYDRVKVFSTKNLVEYIKGQSL